MNIKKILKEHNSKKANRIWNSVLKQLPELSPYDQEELLRIAVYWVFDSSQDYNQRYDSFANDSSFTNSREKVVGKEHRLWLKVHESLCKLAKFYEKQGLPNWKH
jgi:hypothetical protein